MRGVCIPLGLEIRRHLLRARCRVVAEDCAVEELQGCDWLIVRDLVAGFAVEGEEKWSVGCSEIEDVIWTKCVKGGKLATY